MSAQSPTVATASTSIGFSELVALLQQIFIRHGTSPQVAAILAHNCASAERDGAHSHGIFRIPGYLSTLASGWVDGKAVPVVTDVASGCVRVDACNGFAQPALAAARSQLVAKARSAGIALLAIHNSHHFAALWPDVEPFAEEGLVALSVVNSMTCVVPHGADRPLFGTNPIAFAAPRADGAPIVFDLATSAIAHGDVQIAARKGERLEPGMGVDSLGQPTQDPKAILEGGALLPFGGHKGSALSMMVELLAAALTGGNFSFEFNWSDHPGRAHAVDRTATDSDRPKQNRRATLCRAQPGVGAADACGGVAAVAGDRRHRTRAKSQETGIVIEAKDLRQLQELAEG
ncbi:Ldh family oxidoreductase [Pseudomonas sp. ERGC3:05]|nr:Ldh family oxidoreductase [Pseudomonas sp. ERGC3:05]